MSFINIDNAKRIVANAGFNWSAKQNGTSCSFRVNGQSYRFKGVCKDVCTGPTLPSGFANANMVGGLGAA